VEGGGCGIGVLEVRYMRLWGLDGCFCVGGIG
jgi:hypothetical protein